MDTNMNSLKNPLNGLAPEGGFKAWWKSLKVLEKIVLIAITAVFLVVFSITLDANKYRATVHVIAGQGKVGINPTTEALDFGDISPGTSAIRRVDITNGTPIPFFVIIVPLGSISDLMKTSQNFFTVKGRTTTKVEFNVFMPASAPINQTFNGRVFLFKIPGPWK